MKFKVGQKVRVIIHEFPSPCRRFGIGRISKVQRIGLGYYYSIIGTDMPQYFLFSEKDVEPISDIELFDDKEYEDMLI